MESSQEHPLIQELIRLESVLHGLVLKRIDLPKRRQGELDEAVMESSQAVDHHLRRLETKHRELLLRYFWSHAPYRLSALGALTWKVGAGERSTLKHVRALVGAVVDEVTGTTHGWEQVSGKSYTPGKRWCADGGPIDHLAQFERPDGVLTETIRHIPDSGNPRDGYINKIEMKVEFRGEPLLSLRNQQRTLTLECLVSPDMFQRIRRVLPTVYPRWLDSTAETWGDQNATTALKLGAPALAWAWWQEHLSVPHLVCWAFPEKYRKLWASKSAGLADLAPQYAGHPMPDDPPYGFVHSSFAAKARLQRLLTHIKTDFPVVLAYLDLRCEYYPDAHPDFYLPRTGARRRADWQWVSSSDVWRRKNHLEEVLSAIDARHRSATEPGVSWFAAAQSAALRAALFLPITPCLDRAIRHIEWSLYALEQARNTPGFSPPRRWTPPGAKAFPTRTWPAPTQRHNPCKKCHTGTPLSHASWWEEDGITEAQYHVDSCRFCGDTTTQAGFKRSRE